jgi:uncharacterized membrane protein
MTALFLAFLIGVLVGLRCLTPPAVLAWAATLGWIGFATGPLHFLANKIVVVALTLAALGELIGDKLPSSPSRTAPLGLYARIVLGAFSGGCIAMAGSLSFWLGAPLGLIGGLLGCFGGFQMRTRTVKALKCPDFVIALLEDAVAIGGSLFVVSRF